jgi:CubicO group peptidase (beta-lactamase class C family)
MPKEKAFTSRPRLKNGFFIAVLIICLFSFFLTIDCKISSPDLEARIQRIEKGLVPQPGIVIKGQTASRLSLADRMEAYKIPGVSIAVIDNFKIEWAKGYGVKDEESSDPITPKTLFQAASISKPVAAFGALYFVEKGLLDLDEDVNGRLTSWKVPENQFTDKKKVSLRGIMTHSAGLTVHGFGGYAQGKQVPTLIQILDGEKPSNSAPIRVDVEPGKKNRYSGGGFTVMQQLMIDVSGKTFPEIMRGTVLDKIGMEDSTYEQPLPESHSEQGARAHRVNGTMIKGKWHAYPEMAAAGLWTTPTDLCRFALEIMLSKKGKSNKVLSQKMVQEMLSAQNESVGLGLPLWNEGKDFRFMHGGSNAGFKCVFVAYPERGQGVAIMTNGDQGSNLYQEILRSLSTEYGWKDFKPREKAVASISEEIYESYTGTYEFNQVRQIKITKEERRLFADPIFVNPTGYAKCEIYPESETEFFMTQQTDQIITFTKDTEGKVTGLILEYRGRKMKAAKLD